MSRDIFFVVRHSEDNWRTEFTAQPDGQMLVRVSEPGGRSWQGIRPEIAAAIELGRHILEEQRAALQSIETPTPRRWWRRVIAACLGGVRPARS